jgi:hypothetical protein
MESLSRIFNRKIKHYDINMLAVPLGTFFKLLLSAIANTCMMQKQGAFRTVLAVVPSGRDIL